MPKNSQRRGSKPSTSTDPSSRRSPGAAGGSGGSPSRRESPSRLSPKVSSSSLRSQGGTKSPTSSIGRLSPGTERRYSTSPRRRSSVQSTVRKVDFEPPSTRDDTVVFTEVAPGSHDRQFSEPVSSGDEGIGTVLAEAQAADEGAYEDLDTQAAIAESEELVAEKEHRVFDCGLTLRLPPHLDRVEPPSPSYGRTSIKFESSITGTKVTLFRGRRSTADEKSIDHAAQTWIYALFAAMDPEVTGTQPATQLGSLNWDATPLNDVVQCQVASGFYTEDGSRTNVEVGLFRVPLPYNTFVCIVIEAPQATVEPIDLVLIRERAILKLLGPSQWGLLEPGDNGDFSEFFDAVNDGEENDDDWRDVNSNNNSDDDDSISRPPSEPNVCLRKLARICKMIAPVLFVVAIILCVTFIPSSLNKVGDNELGLEYNGGYSRKLATHAVRGGLYHTGPGGSFIKFRATQITDEVSAAVLTADGITTTITMAASYAVNASKVRTIVDEWGDEAGLRAFIRVVLASVLYDSGLKFTLREFYAQRHAVQSAIQNDTAAAFDYHQVHCRLEFIELENIDFPASVDRQLLATTVAEQDVRNAQIERASKILDANIRLQLNTARAELLTIEAQREVDRIRTDSDAAVLLEQSRILAYSNAFSNISSDIGLGGRYFVEEYLPSVILKNHGEGRIFVDGD